MLYNPESGKMNCFHYLEAQFHEDKEIQSRYAFQTKNGVYIRTLPFARSFPP